MYRAHQARRIRRTAGLVATTFAVAIVAGCQDDSPSPAPTSQAPQTATDATADATAGSSVATTAAPTSAPEGPATTTPPTSGTGVASQPLDAAAAVDVALGTTPGAVIDLGPGLTRGGAVWEVVVRQDDGSGLEHYISVSSGEVVSTAPARVPTIAASGPAVPIQELLTIVATEIPDGTVLEAGLGTERGRVVWEVLVRSPGAATELYVDATTGEILKSEPAS